MKLLEYHDIVNPQLFQTSPTLAQAWKEIEEAIQLTDWPHGSGAFTIYPESGKARDQGNGVKPIKAPCMKALQARGWKVESLPDIGSTVLGTGDLDALKLTDDGYIAFEWETGNTCMIFCFILQAVLYDTPICRFSSNADIPVFACVTRWIAKNHLLKGNFVLANMVPLITEVWW